MYETLSNASTTKIKNKAIEIADLQAIMIVEQWTLH